MYAHPSDVALAVAILVISVIAFPLTIVLYCVMEKKQLVVKGGEHLAKLHSHSVFLYVKVLY